MPISSTVLREKLRVAPDDILVTPWARGFVGDQASLIDKSQGIVGQDRAMDALKLGIELEAPGYNVYVCGESGTGRTSTVKDVLTVCRRARKPLLDRCYAMNFKNPDRPRLLEFPAGIGVKFRADMDKLLDRLKKEVQSIFDATDYAKRREKLQKQYERRQRNRVQRFEDQLKKQGFALAQGREGPSGRPEVAPVIKGKLMSVQDVQGLVDAGKFKSEAFQKMMAVLEEKRTELDVMLGSIRKENREFEERLRQLDRDTFSSTIADLVSEVGDRYLPFAAQVPDPRPAKDRPHETMVQKLGAYLSELKEDLIENLDIFREPESQEGEQAADRRAQYQEQTSNYRVNVVLDNTGREQCPVVQETSPTFHNLFGAIERPYEDASHGGAHFTTIKGGSVLMADGGFLIVNAADVFSEPGVWKALKRTLRHRQLEIQNLEAPGYAPPTALKPEPIAVDVKVIMIGDDEAYRMLYALEDDFKKIFKVKSEFDTEMALETGNVAKYLSFITRAVREEKLRPLDRDAVVAVVEYGIRLTQDRKKISTRFWFVADLLREANYFAGEGDRAEISRADVEKAVLERRRRFGLDEDLIQEEFERGQIIVETRGEATGTVNGLTVYDLGDHQFGRPVRITASVAVGRGGIVNVERRAGLSGAIYDKAVMILTGFLMDRFGRNTPINLRASITLEQSYGGIEGDSASSGEVYALLSALSGLPVVQSIAVTGSVNQRGEVQPIGGATFKIEGFFDVCRSRGLTGTQGVMIPRRNVDHLVLRPDVERAINEGSFHIWAVDTIDEGIEILTGTPAGAAGPDGTYPEGTVNFLAARRLAAMNALLRHRKT